MFHQEEVSISIGCSRLQLTLCLIGLEVVGFLEVVCFLGAVERRAIARTVEKMSLACLE